ncbi:hypothetical protein Vi05172_g9047 [Venturia inaequalis]|nr:hypothetical protein Vi05172_g9047 [Venturia inaequalis]
MLPSTCVYSAFIKTQMLRSHLEKREAPFQPTPESQPGSTLGKLLVTPTAASRLLEGWMKHLSTQYPVIHTLRLKELHTRRHDTLDIFEESILHLVYANSGRVLEAIGETGNFYPVQHYEGALKNIDVILELRDARSVAYLLLLALYCFRGPRNPGAWTIAGLAVRMCTELGFHRKSVTRNISMERELQVRIFWSCYYLDRGISVALGRPPAISDDDIDVEFPTDINEEIHDTEALRKSAINTSDRPVSPPTTLTPFIHFMRLRRIESKIEHITYRVDRRSETTPAVIQGFLNELTAWKDAIPLEYHNQSNGTSDHAVGIDNFVSPAQPLSIENLTQRWPLSFAMIPYFKVIRLLIYPQISVTNLNLFYLKTCADACKGICEAYKRLHRMHRTDCSPFAVQALFLTGLTLLHCTWLAPRNHLGVASAISDCNLMLYIMAERCPPAQKYRDIFERINQNITEVMARGDDQATRTEGILDAEMTEKCRALDQDLPDIVRTPYSQIISHFAREAGKEAVHAKVRRLKGYHDLTPQFPVSPGPFMDYGLPGHTHGNLVDSTFLYNWEDLTASNSNWDVPDTWTIP